MTAIEVLDKIAFEYNYNSFIQFVQAHGNEDETDVTLIKVVREAMELYSKQFIDCADNIIIPAMDILPDTYKDDLDAWCKLTVKI